MSESSESRLADALGITTEELAQLTFEIETNESDEGHPYSLRVVFENDTPRWILDKIGVAPEHDFIDISLNTFDEPEDD
jgi:hypothetical protein